MASSNAIPKHYPRLCAGCGKPVRSTRDDCQYETVYVYGRPVHAAWHAGCRYRRQKDG